MLGKVFAANLSPLKSNSSSDLSVAEEHKKGHFKALSRELNMSEHTSSTKI
jgi:hypothetical protein